MKPEPEPAPEILAIPPTLLAEIQAEAEKEHRPALDVLQDAVKRYVRAKRGQEQHGRRVFRTEDLSDAELKAIVEGGMDPRHNHLDAELHRETATPRRTPAEAAARMREQRTGNILPDGITIRDLMTHGRA